MDASLESLRVASTSTTSFCVATDSEEPFALSYDPRQVAALAEVARLEDHPPRALASGEIDMAPQFHMFGAHCGRSFLACGCEETVGVPRGTDYTFRGLPPPAAGASASALLRRWVSCVKMSPTMGAFAADAWFNQYGARTLFAVRARGAVLGRMVDDFRAELAGDATLPVLSRLAGLPDGVLTATAVAVVSEEAAAAYAAFVAGDWAAVTKLGATLLHAAFQTSDPESYPEDDEDLRHLFAGLDVLVNTLNAGYSGKGWRFAVETDRAPATPGAPTKAARDRLPHPDVRKAALAPAGYDDVD